MDSLLNPIVIPVAAGIICLLFPRRASVFSAAIALVVSLLTVVQVVSLFGLKPLQWTSGDVSFLSLRLDNLSGFILLAIAVVGLLITTYSLQYMRGKPRRSEYYAYLLWTIGGAAGAVMANNLLLLLILWGFLGLTLYLLIGIATEADFAAKKTFVIIGGTDALMILGIGLIWLRTNTATMDQISIPASGFLPVLAYLCLAVAAFAKVGAMPFHSWIPDAAEKAPVSATAFLPASLDKLLGIYLLARVSIDLFVMSKALGLLLMIVGALTVIAAVMMALIQSDLKRLLAYLTVAGAGYMVLGIGIGNPIGIAGGLFYMLNSAIWTNCLFLCSGAIEQRLGTADLDKLGGLARVMPITFISCLVAALAISGVPPLNGFVSKWMIYQGLIELGNQGDRLWVIWLVAAMFGSALTLASFMRLMHAAFLGQLADESRVRTIREAPFLMWLPMVILAGLCVVFGVFAKSVPLNNYILPVVPGVSFLGLWEPGLATLLIIVGVAVGALIFLVGKVKPARESEAYVGGEAVRPEMRVSGVEFYYTVRDFGLLGGIYRSAERKLFDIYDLGRNGTLAFTRALAKIHTGVLTNYFSWVLLGLVVLLVVMLAV